MNGLILAGGYSSRMGFDKATISYHDKPQYIYLKELLSKYCVKTFLSTKSKNYPDVSHIYDNPNYQNFGPIAGLKTAFDMEITDWLVLAIDYPYISENEIELILNSKNKLAAVIYNEKTMYFEPYIGLYKSTFMPILDLNINNQNYSLQNILQNNFIDKIIVIKQNNIQNINSEEEYLKLISLKKN